MAAAVLPASQTVSGVPLPAAMAQDALGAGAGAVAVAPLPAHAVRPAARPQVPGVVSPASQSLLTALLGPTPPPGPPAHFMLPNLGRPMTAFASGAAPPMTYQNGGAPIQAHTVVYLVFWGVQWTLGWKDPGTKYTNVTASNYITDFTQFIAASSWPASVTQYCSGVAVGTVNCGGAGIHVGLPITFGGVWYDTSDAAPLPYTADGCVNATVCIGGSAAKNVNTLGKEALHAQAHFLGSGYNPDADYVILLPKEATTGGDYCAYHSSIVDAQGHNVSFINMPYTPNLQVNAFGVATSLCGGNFVNATDDPFGNGYFDGYSMVLGHEIGEAITDPLPAVDSAWRDQKGDENGDMCAWLAPGTDGGAHNIGPDSSGHVYAVQTLWSNSANDCV